MSETRGTRVYVGNLCEKVKKEDLESEFTKYGKVNSVWVAFNPPGFAFVEYESKNDAEKACNALNESLDTILNDKEKLLRVEISKSRPKNRGGPNRFGSGGGRRPDGRSSGPFRSRDSGPRSSRDSGFNRDSGFGDRFRSRSRSDRSSHRF